MTMPSQSLVESPLRVTIIIPCFNANRWLAATIESALAQTWPAVEIIVVDDGSTDRSATIARSYVCDKLQVLDQPNRGACAARNLGLQMATGDYIQFLDADDLLSADKVEQQILSLRGSGDKAISLCSCRYFYDGQSPDDGILASGWPLVNSEDPVAWLVDLLGPDGPGGMVPAHAWLVPRSLLGTIAPWDESIAMDQDGEYFARVVLASKRIVRSARGAVYYRKHGDRESTSCGSDERHHRGALRAIESKARELLARKDDARSRRAIARQYMTCAFLAYPRFPEITRNAIERAGDLGVVFEWSPGFGPLGHRIAGVIGWRVTRSASVLYHDALAGLRRFRKTLRIGHTTSALG